MILSRLIPPQYRLLAAIGAALTLAAASFGAGWHERGLRCDKRIHAIERAAEKVRARDQAKAESEATTYEKDRADANRKQKVQAQAIRTIYRDRAVPGECAVPDDARRVLDDARTQANRQITGESSG